MNVSPLPAPAPAAAPRKPSWRRRLRNWLLALAVIYGVWCLALWWFESKLLYPTYVIGERPKLLLDERAGQRLVEVPRPDGPVKTLVLMPRRASTGPMPVVMVFHGNAELARDHIDGRVTEHLLARGCTVVLPEYRGYGDMPGKPSQQGITTDMVAVADWVKQQRWCDKTRITYFGWSLGSGVACQLAAERKPSGGLILQSAFTSVASFASGYLVPQWLVKNTYHSDRVLALFDAPVLLIHGTQDSVVPVSHGRALSTIAKRGTYVELEGDHFHDWADWQAYYGAIDRWMDANAGGG